MKGNNMSEIKCPNCKESFKLNNLYDEVLSEVLKCPSCSFKASGFSFDFISNAPEEPEEPSEEVKYELSVGGMLVPYTETGEAL
jgi:C4-type Zn-finger protein